MTLQLSFRHFPRATGKFRFRFPATAYWEAVEFLRNNGLATSSVSLDLRKNQTVIECGSVSDATVVQLKLAGAP